MTKIELLRMITEGATVTAEMAEKAAEILAADAKAKEARKGKVSKADQEKRDANAALAAKVAAEVLTTEAKTATDVAAILTEMLGEEVKVQKASYLCRLAVDMGLATQTEVKIPKKGCQKAYTAIEQ
jgi:hypothetical protein